MGAKVFGYARVSSELQSLERQIVALKEYGIEERDIFMDKLSGKDFNRERYQKLKEEHLRDGDTLVVKELDRLGRSYEGLKEEFKYFQDHNINVVVLDMPILNTNGKTDEVQTLIKDLTLSLLSYVADSERKRMLARQKDGIAIAKAQGKYKGRKPIDTTDFPEVYKRWKDGEIKAVEAMKELKMSANTFYRRVKDFEGKGLSKE